MFSSDEKAVRVAEAKGRAKTIQLLEADNKRLRMLLAKIDVHALEGMNGAATYAQDRLCRIHDLAEIA